MTEGQMPRYVVLAAGSTGDVYPLLSMAVGLQRLGRSVTFVTHSVYRDVVEQAGVPFVGTGSDDAFRRILANPALWHPYRGTSVVFERYADELEMALDAIREHADGNTVLVSHAFAVPACMVAHELGWVRSVAGVLLAPSNVKTCHDLRTLGPWRVGRYWPVGVRRLMWHAAQRLWIDPPTLGPVNEFRARHGLGPVNSFMDHVAHGPSAWVAMFPWWFAQPQPDWPEPLLQTGFPLYELPGNGEISTELAQFLDEDDAPLLFTAGTANWHAKAFFEIALSAVQRLGKRALLLTQDRAQLPEHLPTGVCWQRYAPLAKVMPHVSAAVHHGGVGTMAEAFRAGVPQVVTPFAWDQFDNGARVVDLGVGRCVPVRKLSSPVLADKLADIDSDSDVALACRRVSKLMQRQPDALQASQMVDAHWAADTFV